MPVHFVRFSDDDCWSVENKSLHCNLASLRAGNRFGCCCKSRAGWQRASAGSLLPGADVIHILYTCQPWWLQTKLCLAPHATTAWHAAVARHLAAEVGGHGLPRKQSLPDCDRSLRVEPVQDGDRWCCARSLPGTNGGVSVFSSFLSRANTDLAEHPNALRFPG